MVDYFSENRRGKEQRSYLSEPKVDTKMMNAKTMNAKVLFMNGEFLPAEQGVISVRAHGFAYGTGCFEGIRGYWNEADEQVYLFRLREHYERFLRSCKILQIALPYTLEQLIDMSTELVRRNGQKQDVYLRPMAYKAAQ